MKTRNTFGIQFVLRFNKSEEAFGNIFARITVNGKRGEISLKKKIDSKNWDDAKGRVKGIKEDANKLNEHIENGGKLYSWWRIIAIGIIGLLISVCIFICIGLLVSY